MRELQKAIYELSASKGWWEDTEFTVIPTKLMLMVSELAEALEEYREGNLETYLLDGKPEGFGVELADCVIRALDLSEFLGLDMEALVIQKHEYNKSRPYRHGGKLA